MKSVLLLVAALMVLSIGMAGCSHFTGKTAGQSLDDTVITGDIKGKIIKDPDLKTLALHVDSYKGDVTLSGQVPNREAEQRLVRMAQETKGVKSVRTNLEIAGEPARASAPSRSENK